MPLAVSGTKPVVNMQVRLVPLLFIRQPEYWGIEVVGSLPTIGLPAPAPYEVSLPLAGFLGTQGMEVIGASRVQWFDMSPSGTALPEEGTDDREPAPRDDGLGAGRADIAPVFRAARYVSIVDVGRLPTPATTWASSRARSRSSQGGGGPPPGARC